MPLHNGDEDDALRMRWALVCSVPDQSLLNTLSDFASWFLSEVSKVAMKMSIYQRFETRAQAVLHVPVGDFDACAKAYENIRKNWPAVMLALHILPTKNSAEYDWMRILCEVHGFIRQGVLLENALDRFAAVIKTPMMLFLCTKMSLSGSLVLRTGFVLMRIRRQNRTTFIQIRRIILKNRLFWLRGFPSSLNMFGIAQLFNGLKVTGVSLRIDSAIVTFATKFLAFQACALDSKRLDRFHTLRVQPLSPELQDQVAVTIMREGLIAPGPFNNFVSAT
ncbi:hypothetical protein KIN20_020707 [Parelaphostrongylus tenuis]|uniref:Uncharacterized protein n=1 Tax=Parelaphostrongylus tenuis TaxID=148309 RepID=A0AAD5NA11_PARTN|nr:hypothetical protein KIN20_020707 [Parelaphostrongylus tenuis]